MIILDIMLAGESGIDILSQIKNDYKLSEIPVIFVTARSSEIEKVKVLDAGADDYITKPFGIMEFLSRIKAVLRRAVKNAAQNPKQNLSDDQNPTSSSLHKKCLSHSIINTAI